MKQLLGVNRFYGGIADDLKEGLKGSFAFAQNLDIYSNPSQVTLNPKTVKDSGSTVTGLVKWIVSGIPNDTNTYFYDLDGKIYQRTAAGVWSSLRTVASSDGQGLELHNDYLYYTQRTQIGRYGLLSGSPSFTDNWQTGLNDTTNTKFAPIKAFKEGLAVGNGNDLGWWDGSTWTQNKIVLPPGFEIRSLEIIDEYLAIGAWKGSTIISSEEAYIFFWDGTATTFNFFVKSEEGAINAILNSQNRLFSIIGSSGGIYLGFSPLTEIAQLPKIEFSKYCEIYPGAVTNWKNIIHFGVSGATDSSALVQGVYQYGSKSAKYAEGLNFGYTISTGTTTGTGLSIGAVKGIGNQLFIGWKDGSTYGVDRVLQTNDPFASGTIEFLIFDNEYPGEQKLADVLKASHLALVSGESIQLGYKTDRESSYNTGTANSTVGDVTTKLPVKVGKSRFHEFQMEAVLATTGSTSPTLTGISLKFDSLLEEISSGVK